MSDSLFYESQALLGSLVWKHSVGKRIKTDCKYYDSTSTHTHTHARTTHTHTHTHTHTVHGNFSEHEMHIYTLLHELACNIESYCTSGRGIFTSRRRVKMQSMVAIIAICMLISVIKCLLSIPEQRLISSHVKYR